jgi:hypothetical protein
VDSPVWTTEGREKGIGDVSPSGEKGEGRFTKTPIQHLFSDGGSIIFYKGTFFGQTWIYI